MNKSKHLQRTLWDIQKRFGDHALTTLAQHNTPNPAIPFGYPTLDEALESGGISQGQLAALIGTPTCGMTTLAQHLLANAQESTQAGVYIDLAGTFDADYAARCGVAVDRLLVVQPKDTFQALEIARDLVKTDCAALTVIDLLPVTSALDHSGDVPLRRLHDSVLKTHSAVVFLLPLPLNALDPYTQVCLQVQRLDWLREYHDVVGYQVQVTILKDKPPTSGKCVTLDIALDPGVDGDEP